MKDTLLHLLDFAFDVCAPEVKLANIGLEIVAI